MVPIESSAMKQIPLASVLFSGAVASKAPEEVIQNSMHFPSTDWKVPPEM